MDAAAYMSFEDFKKELILLTDKVINFPITNPGEKRVYQAKQKPLYEKNVLHTINGINDTNRMSR
tara:strand:+ start:194 stop:388 length:195 start_codon:yes stop_codon:yes gene_type:complete